MTHTDLSLEKIRDQIAILQVERAALIAPHRGRKVVTDLIAGYLAHAEAAGRAALATALLRADAGQALAPFTVKGAAVVSSAPSAAPFAVDMSGLLVALFGAERLKALLHELCSEIPEIPETPDPELRETQLRKIESELHALELKEEALICRLESEGAKVSRRPDARPEIVLANTA